MQSWLNEARQFSRSEATFIIVGNKKDQEENRVVEMTEAAKFAQENGIITVITQNRMSFY